MIMNSVVPSICLLMQKSQFCMKGISHVGLTELIHIARDKNNTLFPEE